MFDFAFVTDEFHHVLEEKLASSPFNEFFAINYCIARFPQGAGIKTINVSGGKLDYRLFMNFGRGKFQSIGPAQCASVDEEALKVRRVTQFVQ